MLYKTFDLDIKSLDDSGSFSIYFAVFGNVDRGGDIIKAGTFTNLDEFVTAGWIGLNHKNTDPAIGYPTSAVQDGEGLLVSGVFHSTPYAQEIRTIVKERMAAGKKVLGSIGYRITEDTHELRDGKPVHLIEQLEVWECSIVNLPMNPLAEAVEVKSVSEKNKVASFSDLESFFEIKLKGMKSEGGPMTEDAYQKCVKACDDMDEHGRKCIKMAKDFRESIAKHDPAMSKPDEDEKPEKKPEKGDEEEDEKEDDDDESETEKRSRMLRLKALKAKLRTVRP